LANDVDTGVRLAKKTPSVKQLTRAMGGCGAEFECLMLCGEASERLPVGHRAYETSEHRT
jgi:hypothetical protein